MTELFEGFAESFPTPSLDEWKATIEKTLKGGSFADLEKKLQVRTLEGLRLQPLYTAKDVSEGGVAARAESPPGHAPFARGFPAVKGDATGEQETARRGWLPLARVHHPDLRIANARLLEDLMGGLARADVRVADARTQVEKFRGRAMKEPHGGVWIQDEADLASLLEGVYWHLAPVAVRAPGDDDFARRLVEMCASLRAAHGSEGARGGLFAQFDVVETGRVDGSVLMAAIREQTADATGAGATAHFHDGRTVLVSSEAMQCAGADTVQEIAFVLSAFVGVAREVLRSGALDVATLVRATEFRFALGSDFFSESSKLRAFRLCLGRVLEAFDVKASACDVLMSATTSELTLTRRDPYVNLLRTTEQSFAAVLGGVDALTVLPFDTRVNGGTLFGHRLARNVHVLLAEESFAGAVSDPLGGSFYVERRTEELAEAGWTQFSAWEGQGGFFALLASGKLRAAVDAQWQVRKKALNSRREPVLGVSEFPFLEERAPEEDAFDAPAFVSRWAAKLDEAGQRVVAPSAAGAPSASAWPRRSLGEEFERLRDAVETLTKTSPNAGGKAMVQPCVFAHVVGPKAAYAARLAWIRSLFAAGGLRLCVGDLDTSAGKNAEAFQASGAKTVVVISSDEIYETCVPEAVAALKSAGAGEVWMAGNPNDKEARYRAEGVSGFVFLGADVQALLERAVIALGATLSTGDDA